jgi:hypothetical protein
VIRAFAIADGGRAAIVNQSTQAIKPITTNGKPVFQAVIADEKGFGDANTCGLAVLTFNHRQYGAPAGFVLVPKFPAYFAANCWKQ